MTPQLQLANLRYALHAGLGDFDRIVAEWLRVRKLVDGNAPGAGTWRDSEASSRGWTSPMAGTGEGEQ
jgi:hypothetical protein